MIEIKEVDAHGVVKDERWRNMRQALRETRSDIKLAAEQLINMRRQLACYQIFLGRELGPEVDPSKRSLAKKGWKGRSLEKNYLKYELIDLVNHLQVLHPKFHFDPNCLPSSLSSTREHVLSDRDIDVLVNLYENYNLYRSEDSREARKIIQDYIDMKEDYEVKLLQNNVMIDEINAVRKRIDDLRKQANEDKCFMNFLASYKLYEERPNREESETTVRLPRQAEDVAEGSCLNWEKYKKLWEENVKEREAVENAIQLLADRITVSTKRVVEAEELCLENLTTFQDLENEFTILVIKAADPLAGRPTNFKELFWTTKGQLQAATNENLYIRHFLQKSVLSKVPDFMALRASLEATAQKYRRIVEELMPKPEPPKIETKEKKTKGKKKKGKKGGKKKK